MGKNKFCKCSGPPHTSTTLLPESDLRIEKTLASLDWAGVGLATVVANRLWLFVPLRLDSTSVGITVKGLSGSSMPIGLPRMEHPDKRNPTTERVWRKGHRK